MAEEPQQASEGEGEREQAAEEDARDLPVRPEEADQVTGGAVGPCWRN